MNIKVVTMLDTLLAIDMFSFNSVFQYFPEELQFETLYWLLLIAYERKGENKVFNDFAETRLEYFQQSGYFSQLGSELSLGEIELWMDDEVSPFKKKMLTMFCAIVGELPFKRKKGFARKLRGLSEEIYNDIYPWAWLVFDDISYMTDADARTLIQETAIDDMRYALKMADHDTKEKIFSNLSPRVVEDLKMGMMSLGAILVSEVEERQIRVFFVLFKLMKEGLIKAWEGWK